MSKKTASYYIGQRKKSKDIDVSQVIDAAITITKSPEIPHEFNSLADLKIQLSAMCRDYYTACAVSRRRELDESIRHNLFNLIYLARVTIEKIIVLSILSKSDIVYNSRDIFKQSFFGISIKQGIGIRYPLTTCSPTKHCMGRCYGHDGRDRELHLIFRAAYNYIIGYLYENGSQADKYKIINQLKPAINFAAKQALLEAKKAQYTGFNRPPRVRFSQLGEMLRTPNFTNEIALQLKIADNSIIFPIYTRISIPDALNQELFIINQTYDSDNPSRYEHRFDHINYVASSWNGYVCDKADVNFLEHHIEKASLPAGKGFICPVTNGHLVKSCDDAKCAKCFTYKGDVHGKA